MYNYCPNCGEKTGEKVLEFKCKKCSKSFYANSKPTATVVVMCGKELLIGIRGNEPKKGMYDFFGGFLHYGEDPKDGAVREFKEESGYDLDKNKLELLGIWIDDYLFEDVNYELLNVIYLYNVEEKFEVEAADDVAETKWVSINDDLDMAFDHQKKIIEQLNRK